MRVYEITFAKGGIPYDFHREVGEEFGGFTFRRNVGGWFNGRELEVEDSYTYQVCVDSRQEASVTREKMHALAERIRRFYGQASVMVSEQIANVSFIEGERNGG